MSAWDGRRVLVTGAGGFIASHLAEALARAGASVRAFLRYNARGDRGMLAQVPPDIQNGIEVMFGDLRDGDTLRRAAEGIEVIFHLGALIAIPYSYASPRDVVETNVLGTLNVLTAGLAAGVRRIVHTSTSEVYGTARYVPIDEAHPLCGQSPYAASKIGADHLAESFHRSYGAPVTTVRPFNTYGPRQSARAVIPTVISQALVGDVIKIGATTPTRDFNFVGDTVRGFLAVAESGAAEGETFNLGTGTEASVAEMISLVGEIVGRDLTVESDEQRLRPEASEVNRLLADVTRVRERCGWQARVSLKEGLAATVPWVEANLDLFRPAAYAV